MGVIFADRVAVITILFMLPQVSPVSWETFNQATHAAAPNPVDP